MDGTRRKFLDRMLRTPSPSGYEARGQRVWVEYVSAFADDVRTDAYGNAVAIYEGGDPAIAFAGHGDEIGFIVTEVNDEGFVCIAPIGGADRTVSRGQHVTVHAQAGPVAGVIGQTAIHLRDPDSETLADIEAQHVDVGAADGEAAHELVEVGDPVTFETPIRDLQGGRVAARGLDNCVGVWTAAEALRRAAEADVETTIYAVSTVQEELGVQGAKMVGFDLAPDAAIAVDVTHATDNPSHPAEKHGNVALGGGPVVARGSANHPELVSTVHEAAESEDIDVQLMATGIRTGTDADAFYTSRGGIPALNLGIPNRYMHTPVEVVDLADLDAAADLLAAVAARSAGRDGFSVSI